MIFYKNCRVIFPDKIRDCVVAVNDGKIADICDTFNATENDSVVDCNGLYLSPGFVDIHVHGGGGKSAMSTNHEDIIEMARAHRKNGTTSIVPTTLTTPIAQLKEVALTIKKASEIYSEGGILGVHFEGPYISKKYKGAQSENDIITYADSPADELLDIWDKVLIMGAAPEEKGGYLLGEELKKRGIVASVAHSAASFNEIAEAVKHGYSDVTHIYNACSSCFKTGPFRNGGVVEAGLVLNELTTQVIGDLRHLPKELLTLLYKCKGDSRMYLITDGLEFSATELTEDAIVNQANGIPVVYSNGVMLLADKSALAGSCATLKDCVRNMYKTVGVPLYSAVKMATLTPATVINHQNKKGQIKIGCDADLILFDDDLSFVEILE